MKNKYFVNVSLGDFSKMYEDSFYHKARFYNCGDCSSLIRQFFSVYDDDEFLEDSIGHFGDTEFFYDVKGKIFEDITLFFECSENDFYEVVLKELEHSYPTILKFETIGIDDIPNGYKDEFEIDEESGNVNDEYWFRMVSKLYVKEYGLVDSKEGV